MRVPVQYANIKTNAFSVMRYEVESLLNKQPYFTFFVFDIVEQEGEEPIVSYADIESIEPVIRGETTLVINYINSGEIIPCLYKLVDPTWKDLLNGVNDTMIKANIKDAALQTFELTGLSEDGMNYTVEAIMVSQYN